MIPFPTTKKKEQTPIQKYTQSGLLSMSGFMQPKTSQSTPASLGLPQPGETTVGDFFSAVGSKDTYKPQNIKQSAKQAPSMVKDFAGGMAKSANQALIVTPGARIGQAISKINGPDISKADTTTNQYVNTLMQTLQRKDITPERRKLVLSALKNHTRGHISDTLQNEDMNINLGALGSYDIKGQQGGWAGTKQVAGQGLEAASWLATAPKFAALGKSLVQNSAFKLGAYGTVAPDLVKQAFWSATKEGAKNGAFHGVLSGLGSSLQEDKKWSEHAKDAIIGTAFGATLGAAFGAGGAGLSYSANKAKFIQSTFKKYLTDHGVNPELADQLSMKTFNVGMSIKDVSKQPKHSGWTPNLVAKVEGLHKQQGTPLPDFTKPPEGWYSTWLQTVPESKWNPKVPTPNVKPTKTLNYGRPYEGNMGGGKPAGLTKEGVLAPFEKKFSGTGQGSRVDGSPEQIIEKAGGWVTGDRAKFDAALMHGDAKTVQAMLPKIPQEYRAKFAKNINKLIEQNPESGFVLNPFAKKQDYSAKSNILPNSKGKPFEGVIQYEKPNKGLFVDYGKPVDLTKFKGQEGFIKNPFAKFNPKADEAGKAINQANARWVKNPTAANKKALEVAKKEFRMATQGGFVKNPFAKTPTKLDSQIAEAKDLLKQAEKGSGETERLFKGKQFNLDAEQTANLQKMQTVLGLDKRTVRTFHDMTTLGQELQTDIPSLLKNTKKLQITDAEVKGMGDLIKTNSSFLQQAAKDLQTVAKSSDKALLETKMHAAENQIKDALTKLRVGNTENGRAIVANRILAQNIDNPTFWYAKAAKTLNEGGADFTPEIRTAIDSLIKKQDLNGLALFVGNLRSATTAEKVITVWKTGLLTAPPTHIANLSGNTAFAGLENTSSAVATGFDKIASLVTGKRTKSFSLKGLGEEMKGAVQGFKKGINVLKTGQDLDIALSKAEIPKTVNFKSKLLDRYTKTVFGALGAEDKVFKEAALKGSLYEQARVNALNEGLKGEAFKLRVKELFMKPTDQMSMQAIDDSLFRTFNNKNSLAEAVKSFKNSLGPGGKAATEFVTPFVRTPTNIAARMVDYSPAGFLSTIAKQINPETRSQKALVEGLARNVTGTGIIGLGALLADKGLMTGNKLTDQEKAEGKLPNAIKIGDKWLQITRISPIGNLLALGAEYDKLSQEKSGVDLAVSTGFAGVKQLKEQTFLKGVSGVLQVADDPARYSESFLENTAGSLVPAVVGRLGKIPDPKVRNPQGMVDAIKARIPFLSKDVAGRRDIFGAPVKAGGGRFNIVDPFNTTQANDDPILQEANRVKANLTMPSQTVSGMKLENKEYDTYTKVHGKILKVYLDQLIKSPDYQSLDDDAKAKEIEHLQDDVRSAINKSLFPAMMIKRYNLDPNTDPAKLTKVISTFSKEPRFKEFNLERQADTIKGLLRQD